MRLVLPERFPILYVGCLASLLFVLQQVQRTGLFFSACCFLFILVAGITVNAGGGLTRPSGSYAFFYSMLGVIVGLCYKAFLGEPADSNLQQPKLTILVYLAGITAMYGTILLSRRVTRRKAFLENMVPDSLMQSATVGCLCAGGLLYFLTYTVTRVSGTVLSALFQINRFLELAILLGVTHTIRSSGGRRSVSLPVLFAGAIIFLLGGIFGFSKEAMFTPFVCWALAASAQRFRLKRSQILLGGVAFLFLAYYMVPYSQYGRTQSVNNVSGNLGVAINLVSNLGAVRAQYDQAQAAAESEGERGYFDKPQGLANRLQMIFVDDALIHATDEFGPYGLNPILIDLENLVPHVLWANKPAVLWGNVYAHQAGLPLAEEDVSTGVSFTPTAEAFHLARWSGIFVLAPIIWGITFVLFDSLCGDVRRSPWALLMTVGFAHVAPEGMLASLIYLMGYGTFAVVFAAVTSAYIMPLVGTLLIGPGSAVHVHASRVRSLPRRVQTTPAAEGAGS